MELKPLGKASETGYHALLIVPYGIETEEYETVIRGISGF